MQFYSEQTNKRTIQLFSFGFEKAVGKSQSLRNKVKTYNVVFTVAEENDNTKNHWVTPILNLTLMLFLLTTQDISIWQMFGFKYPPKLMFVIRIPMIIRIILKFNGFVLGPRHTSGKIFIVNTDPNCNQDPPKI